MTRKIAVMVAAGVALGTAVGGIAIAAGSGDDDRPLTGSTLEKATAAALEHTGGGTVLETEAGDDGAAYGVEIRLADGTQAEVSLDRSFNVIGRETDDDRPNEDAGQDDD